MVKRDSKEILTGIYKITNPLLQVYVGQARDIFGRFHTYQRKEFRSMGVKLANSIKKFGTDNHFYEIIEECSINELDNREKYWIKTLNVKLNGLNSTIGGNGLIQHSEESKKAISEAKKGKPSPLRGRTRSFKGRISPTKGYKRSKKSIQSQIQKMKGTEQKGRGVKCLITKKEWISASQCAKEKNVSVTTIFNWVKNNKNNLTLI